MSEQLEDILLPFIVTLLTPFFLPMTSNLDLAQKAAASMLRQMQSERDTDLIHIAQIIALGLASLNTLGRTLDADLDPILLLKLNNSAVALSRCEDRKRTALKDRPIRKSPPRPITPEEEAEIQADTEAQIQSARNLKLSAERIMQIQQNPEEAAKLKQRANGRPYTTDPEKLNWVCQYAQVAEECARDPETYAGGSQKVANMKARLLNTCAWDVLSGAPIDTSQLRGLNLPSPTKRS